MVKKQGDRIHINSTRCLNLVEFAQKLFTLVKKTSKSEFISRMIKQMVKLYWGLLTQKFKFPLTELPMLTSVISALSSLFSPTQMAKNLKEIWLRPFE